MADNTTLINRPLTDAESEEFRALGISPGHWLALAPLPLFRPDLFTPLSDDLQTLASIQKPLQVEPHHQQDPERIAETKLLWKKMCQRSISPEGMEIGNALLSWFLATRVARNDRERFLSELDNTAVKFSKSIRSLNPSSQPSYTVRQQLERYLPHPRYTRYPADPRVSPPNPSQVAEVLGVDLWKQMLVAPIVGALGDLQIRPSAAASVADLLAHVTIPSIYSKPSQLETYLSSGNWRRLFNGLFNPSGREETKPLIDSGLDIAACGLASLSFAERESLFQAIHEQIVRGVEQPDQRKITAGTWIALMRTKVEDVIAQAEAVSLSINLPVKEIETTSASGPVPTNSETRRTPDSDLPSSSPITATNPTRPNTQPISMKPVTPPGSPPTPAVPPSPAEPQYVVEHAQPFKMVTWEETLASVSRVPTTQIIEWLKNPDPPPLLFDDQRAECNEVVIVRDAKLVPSVLWIIGDLHADVLTLANIIAHAERVNPEGSEPPAFVFLGDFVDRGRHDHETLLLLFQFIVKNPSRVCVIPGNHDIDLQWDEKAEKFRVTIEPAEYCERLNSLVRSEDLKDRVEVEFARLLINFLKKRPKAAILPDGTLLAHGGFPHTDMQVALKKPDHLGLQFCQNDFLWARIAETARKRPNRGNRGHEFGWETFNQFCKVSAQIGVPTVKRFVRGHDHVAARWQYYPDYAENPVLTINAMGRRMDGEPESASCPHPFPVMARYVPNKLPVVVLLPLDPNEVNRAFGKDGPRATADSSKSDALSTAIDMRESQAKDSLPLKPPGDVMDAVALGVQIDPLQNLLPKPSGDSQG